MGYFDFLKSLNPAANEAIVCAAICISAPITINHPTTRGSRQTDPLAERHHFFPPRYRPPSFRLQVLNFRPEMDQHWLSCSPLEVCLCKEGPRRPDNINHQGVRSTQSRFTSPSYKPTHTLASIYVDPTFFWVGGLVKWVFH